MDLFMVMYMFGRLNNNNNSIMHIIIQDNKMSGITTRKHKHINRSSLSVLQDPEASVHLPSIQSKINRHESAISSYRLIDYSMDRVKYKAEPQKYLSSKIDFFNSENQRKLDVSKHKILVDIGVIPSPPRHAPVKIRRKNNLQPELHSLVQKYFKQKEMRENEEGNYLVVGTDNKLYC